VVGFEVAGSVEFEGEAVGWTELVFAVVDGTAPVLLLSADSEVDVAVVVAAVVDGTVDEVVGYAVGTVRHVLEATAEIDMSSGISFGQCNKMHVSVQSLMKSRLFIQHMQIWSRKPWQPVCGTHLSRQGHCVQGRAPDISSHAHGEIALKQQLLVRTHRT